jgi:hypothetical protein
VPQSGGRGGGGGGGEWWVAASVSRVGMVEQGSGDMDRPKHTVEKAKSRSYDAHNREGGRGRVSLGLNRKHRNPYIPHVPWLGQVGWAIKVVGCLPRLAKPFRPWSGCPASQAIYVVGRSLLGQRHEGMGLF